MSGAQKHPRPPSAQRLRERAEAALRRSEERYRSLVVLVSDWYWEQDAQHRFVRIVRQGAAEELPTSGKSLARPAGKSPT